MIENYLLILAMLAILAASTFLGVLSFHTIVILLKLANEEDKNSNWRGM